MSTSSIRCIGLGLGKALAQTVLKPSIAYAIAGHRLHSKGLDPAFINPFHWVRILRGVWITVSSFPQNDFLMFGRSTRTLLARLFGDPTTGGEPGHRTCHRSTCEVRCWYLSLYHQHSRPARRFDLHGETFRPNPQWGKCMVQIEGTPYIPTNPK